MAVPSSGHARGKTTLMQKLAGLKGLLPFTAIFAFIIAGIYAGFFTPTEAAAIGAALTLAIALMRGMTWAMFVEAINETLSISAMIFFMIIGAEIFGFFLSVSRISYSLVDYVQSLNMSPYMVLFAVLMLFILMGCVMDSIAMLLLTVPVVFPLIQAAGFDPIWFGIVAVITVEVGLITPPVGMNVFVIKSLDKELNVTDIFKGVIPFILSDVVRLGLLIAFPSLALALL
ncbi:TRAP transporter large permease subunit [Vibrio ostreae]|uniref:TRAP transporter large permease subunit n=1 Tax=Vibrio ostreae TaxID=2841925 RepID=UPI002115AA07|nr:TRAP transporter large permease subunit [Vibrio ostreae]